MPVLPGVSIAFGVLTPGAADDAMPERLVERCVFEQQLLLSGDDKNQHWRFKDTLEMELPQGIQSCAFGFRIAKGPKSLDILTNFGDGLHRGLEFRQRDSVALEPEPSLSRGGAA